MIAHRELRAVAIVAVGFLLALVTGCPGGSTGTPVIPTLPGDGDEHTAKPAPPGAEDSGKDDLWSGRDDLIEPPAAKPPSAVKLPKITRFRLKNGMKVIVVESRDLPIVEMQLAVNVGRANAPRDKMGIAEFAAAMLTRGTKTRDALQIAQMIDFVGGTLNCSASYEATLVRCSVLAKDIGTCLKLLPDVVANPAFRDEEMQVVAGQLKVGVIQRREDPGSLATAHFHNLLWGDEHARGWPVSLQTIDAIAQKDLRSWHRAWLRPNNAVLAVAGDVEPKKLRANLEKAFRRWRKGKLPKRGKYAEPALSGIKVRMVHKPGQTKTQLRVGHLGIEHGSPDFFDTLVVNHILGGGGFSSRLMRAVGAGSGTPHGASSSFDRNADKGAFVARASARNKETVSTLRHVVQEIQKMASSGPTETEVANAIANIAGRYSTGFESTTALANSVLAAELHGFDEEYVRDFALAVARVTPESARKAAARHLDSGNLAVVVVGDAGEIEPQLKAIGLEFERVNANHPVAKYEREPEPEDPAAADAEGRRILEKALEAKGGHAKLSEVKTVLLEGSAKAVVKQAGGAPEKLSARVKRVFVAPNRMRRDTDINSGKVVTVIVLDGDKAWASQSQGGQAAAAELPPDYVNALKEELWRDQEFILLRHREKGAKVAALPEKKIKGVAHYAVRVTRTGGKLSLTLYIDKKTFLIRRMTYTAAGLGAVEEYENYKDVGGIKVAHRRRIGDAQSSFDVTIEKAKFNLAIDPKIFAKPEK